MKDQYFGDIRDYFKFDLMIFLAQNLPGIQRFTFIPMLTKDDKSGQGRKTEYASWQPDTVGLYAFLKRCIRERRRSVARLRTLFGQGNYGFQYCPYRDDYYFTHQERKSYFGGIPDEFLRQAVIMLDPDTGLEVRTMGSSTGHRYIKYDELKDIYSRMSDASVLIIFQFFPHEKHQPYLRKRFQELRSVLQCEPPIAVSDNEIAFIAITKSHNALSQVRHVLREYVPRNHRFWMFDDFVSP
jgi:hypothetical protein